MLAVSGGEGLTWQAYFLRVHPAFATAGKEAECAPLTVLFQRLAVGNAVASVNAAARPAQPPHSPALLEKFADIMVHHFSHLALDFSTTASVQIARELGTLRTDAQAWHEEAMRKKDRRRRPRRRRPPRSGWAGRASTSS